MEEAQPQSPLSLTFRRAPGALHPLVSASVTYVGQDEYRVRASGEGGARLSLSFLSRAAVAEFLEMVLQQEHEGELRAEGFEAALCELEELSAPELMRALLLLRDARD